MSGPEAAEDDVPTFTVVAGQPTDEEVAALVVVLSSLGSSSSAQSRKPASGWSAYARTIRQPIPPGPDAWRMSGRQ